MGKNVFKDLTGQKFGRLTVVECIHRAFRTPDGKLKSTTWLCKCDCGGETKVTSSGLKGKGSQSCGCLHKERTSSASLDDLTGRRFGRLLVLERALDPTYTSVMWKCLCDCGNTHITHAGSLKMGYTKSCGCYNIDATHDRARHSMCTTDEYATWLGIKRRCYDENAENYKYYGAVGITVSNDWLDSFSRFFEDMGAKPTKSHSIERRDFSKGYNSSNCYWGTPIEQANNKRNNVIVEFMGRTQTLKQWCRELDLAYKVVHARLQTYHWSAANALSTPTNSGFDETAKYMLDVATVL